MFDLLIAMDDVSSVSEFFGEMGVSDRDHLHAPGMPVTPGKCLRFVDSNLSRAEVLPVDVFLFDHIRIPEDQLDAQVMGLIQQLGNARQVRRKLSPLASDYPRLWQIASGIAETLAWYKDAFSEAQAR